MSYIGAPYQNLVSPNFVKEDFTAAGLGVIYVNPEVVLLEDGDKVVLEDATLPSGVPSGNLIQDSTLQHANAYELTHEVPGGNEENLHVVLDNVVQEPEDAYTIEQNTNGEYRILKFDGTPVSTADIYVVHRGIGTINTAPAAGSVTAATLSAGLRSFTTDAFVAGVSQTDYIMSQQPYAIGAILVTVDGIVQKATTNYTLATTSITNDTLRFTSAPDEDAEIEVKHLGFLTTARRIADSQVVTAMIADGSITSAKLAAGEDWGLITGALDSNLDFGSVS